jgi:hypothetical protein
MLLSTHSERLPVGGQCCAWPGEFWVPKAVHVLLRALLALTPVPGSVDQT